MHIYMKSAPRIGLDRVAVDEEKRGGGAIVLDTLAQPVERARKILAPLRFWLVGPEHGQQMFAAVRLISFDS
jgi:hypothetical protein